jgi:ubiquinone/menaquinone biosynthesis C-methylase UbiE
VAGDDSPFYRYKRQKLANWLKAIDFENKKVLELGSGPGGNLHLVSQKNPSRLVGADISSDMIALAKQRLSNPNIELFKIDGQVLPFEDNSFDIVFSVTVLQHNTDEIMLKNILKELCRVSEDKLILFERIESNIKGSELCLGRPVEYYSDLCSANGLKLESVKFINIQTSWFMAGAIRKLLNSKSREEGQPLNRFSWNLQNFLLPLTRQLDKIFTSKRDLAQLTFVKN